jgi:hypothetical protein
MNSTPHVDEIIHGNILEVDLHGRLAREDYEDLEPSIERMIQRQGKINVLVTMHDFDGWSPGALWEDLKWEAKHFSDIEKLAIVGEEDWHKWMTRFCDAFTNAEVRYFTLDQLGEAHVWLNG